MPDGVWKDVVFSARRASLRVVFCALLLRSFRPQAASPIPTIMQTVPKPDFFFLWLYALLALLPPQMETPVLLIGPVIDLGCLIAAAVSLRRR